MKCLNLDEQKKSTLLLHFFFLFFLHFFFIRKKTLEIYFLCIERLVIRFSFNFSDFFSLFSLAIFCKTKKKIDARSEVRKSLSIAPRLVWKISFTSLRLEISFNFFNFSLHAFSSLVHDNAIVTKFSLSMESSLADVV